jgi:hypothetical protein
MASNALVVLGGDSLVLENSGPNSASDLPTAGLRFAAAFHRDVLACATSPEKLTRVHRDYRDKILEAQGLTSSIAAAFHPLLRATKPVRLSENESRRWDEFDALAQRAQNSRDRTNQKLRHEAAIIAAWGPEVFQHYNWSVFPADVQRRLHDLASLVPRWSDAVLVLNRFMLSRHELRVVGGSNLHKRIGEHSSSSLVQAEHSPVERKDIVDALNWAREKDGPVESRILQIRPLTDTIRNTPIRDFGLGRDRYGMVVPAALAADEFSEVSESPTPAVKRLRIQAPDGSGAFRSWNHRQAAASVVSTVPSNVSTPTTDVQNDQASDASGISDVRESDRHVVEDGTTHSPAAGINDGEQPADTIEDVEEPDVVSAVSHKNTDVDSRKARSAAMRPGALRRPKAKAVADAEDQEYATKIVESQNSTSTRSTRKRKRTGYALYDLTPTPPPATPDDAISREHTPNTTSGSQMAEHSSPSSMQPHDDSTSQGQILSSHRAATVEANSDDEDTGSSRNLRASTTAKHNGIEHQRMPTAKPAPALGNQHRLLRGSRTTRASTVAEAEIIHEDTADDNGHDSEVDQAQEDDVSSAPAGVVTTRLSATPGNAEDASGVSDTEEAGADQEMHSGAINSVRVRARTVSDASAGLVKHVDSTVTERPVGTSISLESTAPLRKPVVGRLESDEMQAGDPSLPGQAVPKARVRLLTSSDNAELPSTTPLRAEPVLDAIRARHLQTVQNLSDDLQLPLPDAAAEELRTLKTEWLDPQAWASIYAEPEAELGLSSASADEADVWYLTWESFKKYADRGFVFDRPVVIKQQFLDSGMYDIHEYMHQLWCRFPEQPIDVHNGRTGECSQQIIADFVDATSQADLSSTIESAPISNAINLGRLARADEPLLTRLSRFRLLSIVVDRLNSVVGKKQFKEPSDVESSLTFNLLGFAGAFSRPHMDCLLGTWVRCLFGSKIWVIVPRMDENDWESFAREGCNWSPRGKARIVILEKDDVLLMPPGVRTVHAVFTPEPCLIEGGMLWDDNCLPETLQGLLWVGRNQACTNEAIAYQMPALIDALEQWAFQMNQNNASKPEDIKYYQDVQAGIAQLRELGCDCRQGCQRAKVCRCRDEERRCTAWCRNHPRLPRQYLDAHQTDGVSNERATQDKLQASPSTRRTRMQSQSNFECMIDG